MFYDRLGQPISVRRWAELNGSPYKRLALEEWGGVRISTVWLGFDHSFGAGPPLIFETMTFTNHPDWEDRLWRYTTEEQAWAGHEAICAELRVLTGHDAEAGPPG